MRGAAHNPFCSERVRPGSIPYLLDENLTIHFMTRGLEENGFVGQILGPHGTGKSTVLYSLAAELGQRGKDVVIEEARHSRATTPRPGQIVLLDSAERLPRRTLQMRACRTGRSGGGLVLTTHSDLGLPILLQTTVTPKSAHQIVRRLLEGWEIEAPSESGIVNLLERHNGNMRLVLFELYDWFEEQSAR